MFDYQPARHSGARLCKYTHDPGGGCMLTLIRILNYFCIVCPVCLFILLESCDRDQGGVVISLTPKLFTSSLPLAISPSLPLSHLAVKWRNVFKALPDFTVIHFIVHRCSGMLPGSRGPLLFLENPLDEDVCCLESRSKISGRSREQEE